jgi:hypothetical protein
LVCGFPRRFLFCSCGDCLSVRAAAGFPYRFPDQRCFVLSQRWPRPTPALHSRIPYSRGNRSGVSSSEISLTRGTRSPLAVYSALGFNQAANRICAPLYFPTADSPVSRKRASSPPSTGKIKLFGSCVLNRRWVFLVLLPSQLIQPAHGGSWVVSRVRRVREQRGSSNFCLLV